MINPEAIPTLPGFANLKPLGRGAYGRVFHALNETNANAVALKFCPKLPDRPDISIAAKNEATVLQSLSHPNIVRISTFIETEHFLVLELSYLSGELLQTILDRTKKENSKLDERFIVAVISQLASALDYLDRQNVIHFDIKPNNIMIDGDFHDDSLKVTLFDFGIAQKTDAPPTSGSVSSGTLTFLAPEIATGDPPYTTAVDIWCFGVTLYRMLYSNDPPRTKKNN
jgi:serine/threonine kinase 32